MKILRKLLGLLGALVVLSGCLTAGACNNDFSSVDNREDGILLFDLIAEWLERSAEYYCNL